MLEGTIASVEDGTGSEDNPEFRGTITPVNDGKGTEDAITLEGSESGSLNVPVELG